MIDFSAYTDEELEAIAAQGAQTPTKSAPRGIRNNNPLNLEATVNWTGMTGNDGRFARFETMDQGVAAADRNLQTYATKHGLNTVSGIIGRWAPSTENDTNSYAMTVARELGVDPNAPLDMSDPGVRRQLIASMARVENGQPVDIPEIPMQDDFSGYSDEELAAIAAQADAQPREVAASANRGVTIETLPPEAPAPQQARPPIPRRAGSAPTQNPTIAQDAWSGFVEPFKALGGAVMDRYNTEKAQALAGPPTSAGEALKRTLGGLGSMAGIAGDVLGLTAAPVQAAVRPTARAINRLPITPYVQDSPFTAPRPAQGEEAQALVEGSINKALSAARPATPKPTIPVQPKPKPMGVEELRAAKTAAYDAVDNLGVAYAPKATARLADDLGYDLAGKRINPKVTPKAHAVMEDVQAQLKSGTPVTISQIDDMRQQVWRATGKADDAEQFFGSRIREMLDDFIDGAGPAQVVNGNAPEAAAALNNARDLNTRWRKVQEVANRTESADLRASTTYAGGNKANAVRQNLRPLIDPKSPQRIKNLTPAETKALNKAVRGTGTANAARVVGKLLDPRGLLGQVALGPIGIPTVGVAPTVGAISSEISNAATMKAVKDLVKLMSVGGAKPQPIPPRLPIMSLAGRPPVSLFSFPGAVGASELAAPLTRIPSAPSKKAGATKEPVRPRKK